MRIFNQKYIYIYAKIKMSAINNFSGLCLDISVMVCMTWICGGGVGVLFTLERVISTWIC